MEDIEQTQLLKDYVNECIKPPPDYYQEVGNGGHKTCPQHDVFEQCKTAVLDRAVRDFPKLMEFIEDKCSRFVEYVRYMQGTGLRIVFPSFNNNNDRNGNDSKNRKRGLGGGSSPAKQHGDGGGNNRSKADRRNKKKRRGGDDRNSHVVAAVSDDNGDTETEGLSDAVAVVDGQNQPRRSPKNECYVCGRSPRHKSACTLTSHPDANSDPTIRWRESPGGKRWLRRDSSKSYLPAEIDSKGNPTGLSTPDRAN